MTLSKNGHSNGHHNDNYPNGNNNNNDNTNNNINKKEKYKDDTHTIRFASTSTCNIGFVSNLPGFINSIFWEICNCPLLIRMDKYIHNALLILILQWGSNGLLIMIHDCRLRLLIFMNYYFLTVATKYSEQNVPWRHQMETFSALLAICAGNSPVPGNSPHKSQWRGALMFSLICVWINNREAGDLRRYRAHYDVTVILASSLFI